VGVVGVFLGANTSKQNVRHGRAFSTAAAQLGDFRATSGRRSECQLRWLGGMHVRALGSPLCPLGHLFSAGGPSTSAWMKIPPFANQPVVRGCQACAMCHLNSRGRRAWCLMVDVPVPSFA
jgi:hypothetical protein